MIATYEEIVTDKLLKTVSPGIFQISNEAYHSGPGLSSSDLKELLKSPAHWKAYKETPKEETPEMLRGTLVHTLILEPEKFETDFIVGDFKDRRNKEYAKLCEENPGKTVVSCSDLEECKRIVTRFKEQQAENPELQKLLDGTKEASFYWEDDDTGILCKCRPDVLTRTGQITDIKTARDASFDGFQKAIIDYGYFISAPYYLRGVHSTVGSNLSPVVPVLPTEFCFVVIETKEPYLVSIFRFKRDSQALRLGNQCVDMALRNYAEAVSTDNWFGYTKQVIDIDLPNWALYKLNGKLGKE